MTNKLMGIITGGESTSMLSRLNDEERRIAGCVGEAAAGRTQRLCGSAQVAGLAGCVRSSNLLVRQGEPDRSQEKLT
ncbi:hypothetical protein [Burkholderia cepacia]|uniref:hypothetical protein n=1 Tax=Burkholderia cepacia TaxID=292 RepID=UPI0026E0A0D3|nr:hypothetical protein [Burkholderia cepacia]MDO5947185.1 hypothetical protein [Burkholderia cepacia]